MELTLRDKLVAVAERFDPKQDGEGIGIEATFGAFHMANEAVSKNNSVTREYIRRIQMRELGLED